MTTTEITSTDKMIVDYIIFANAIAARRKKNIPNCVSIEEIRSAAYFGLVDASKRFDGRMSFATFAGPRIEGAITDYLRELRWGSRRRPVTTTEFKDDNGKETKFFDDLFEVLCKFANKNVRQILTRHFMEGQTQTDIANSLGTTRSNVNQIIKRFATDVRSRWTVESLCG